MSDLFTGIVPGLVTGRIAGVDPDGLLLVAVGEGAPRAVPSVWMAGAPAPGQLTGARVVLGFLEGDETRPIVLGLLDAPAAAAPDAPAPEAPAPEAPAPAKPGEPEAMPKVVRIASTDEIVLECGKAKVMLRADGRVVIRGGYLVSRSTGPNKVKGASVQIN